MVEHIVSLLLVGLGLQTPDLPSVLGDSDGVEKRMEFRQERIASREANLERRKEIQEQFKTSVEAKREEAKAQYSTQREAFKKRLETIKDETKKARVETMDSRLSELNTKRTAQMTETINKIDEVLSKANLKIDEMESIGRDVAQAKSAASDAQAKITLAKSAIATQATKEYVIGVTSENKLGSDVSRAIQALRKDLDATQQLVKSAREAVTTVVKQVALTTNEKS